MQQHVFKGLAGLFRPKPPGCFGAWTLWKHRELKYDPLLSPFWDIDLYLASEYSLLLDQHRERQRKDS